MATATSAHVINVEDETKSLETALANLPAEVPIDQLKARQAYLQVKQIATQAIENYNKLKENARKTAEDHADKQRRQEADIASLMNEVKSLGQKVKSLKRELRKHTVHKKKFDLSKLPDALISFKPLVTDKRVDTVITGGGPDSDVPSIHALASDYLNAKTGDADDKLRARVAALQKAYRETIHEALNTTGWFRRCHQAIMAGNNAFREVYDQVWGAFIETGEADGVQRYKRAVAHLRKHRDETVTKQQATDVLTLYQDAARAQPLFQDAIASLVEQCKRVAEKEARLRYLNDLQRTGDATALKQRLRAYFDAADIDNNGKLSRSELQLCVLQATHGSSAPTTSATRNRRMRDGEGGAGQKQLDTTAVRDLKVQKSWRRDAVCTDHKDQHLESLSRAAGSREQWVLDTVLCGNRYALHQNMFPFALPCPDGEPATEHWVFWSAGADTPSQKKFLAFVSARLQAAHATTGCSWGYREFEYSNSIPGLFHAHVFCRPHAHAAWLSEDQQPTEDKATAARRVDEADLQSAKGPTFLVTSTDAEGNTAYVPMSAPDTTVLRALFPANDSLSCESLAGGNSPARVYAVVANTTVRLSRSAHIRAVVKIDATIKQITEEARQLNTARGLLGPTAVPALLQDPVEVQLADGSLLAGLASEMVLEAGARCVVGPRAHDAPNIAPSLSSLLGQIVNKNTTTYQAPLRVHAALRDVFGPGGMLRSLAERTVRRAEESGPAAGRIARSVHAASMEGPRIMRDRIASHLDKGSFQPTHLTVFRQACRLSPINHAEGVTEHGLREVIRNVQWYLVKYELEKEAASLDDIELVHQDLDGGGGRGVDPVSLRFLTCVTHGDLNPRNVLSRGGDAPPCLVDLDRFGPGRYLLSDIARLMFLILHETPIDTAEELAEARGLSDRLFGEHASAARDLHELPSVDLSALSSNKLRVAASCVLQLWQYCGPLVARCGGTPADLHPFGLLLTLHGTALSRLLYLGPVLFSPRQQEWALHTASVLTSRVSDMMVRGLDLPSGFGSIEPPKDIGLTTSVELANVDALLTAVPFNADGELNYKEFAESPEAINLLVNAMSQAECDRALHDEDYEGNDRTALFDFVLNLAPGLKKIPRIIEKSMFRNENEGDVSCVKDVVRAMVVVQRMDQVAVVAEQLQQRDDIVVVRLKERFLEAPSAGGWRDLMVSFYLRADNERRHICELQVVHEMMLHARKSLPGHVVYGRVRNAMELLEKDRGAGAAADTLALADLLDANGPGRMLGKEGGYDSYSSRSGYGSHDYYHCHHAHVSDHSVYLKDKAWLGDGPVREWEFVVAGARVKELHLKGLDLQGDLPVSLGALGQLEVLDLRGNTKLCLAGVPLDSCAEAFGLPVTEAGEPLFNTKETCQAALKIISLDERQLDLLSCARKLAKKHSCADAVTLKALHEQGLQKAWVTGDAGEWTGVTLGKGSDGNRESRVVEKLEVSKNSEITKISREIGDLSGLHTLIISACPKLTSLPDRICDLSRMHTWTLTWCRKLTALPDRIGDLSSLQTLNLHGCDLLTHLPASIGKMASLHTLNLSECRRLTALPDSVCDLAKLHTLNVDGKGYIRMNLKALPERIGDLSNLQTLNLRRCERLESLPNRIGDLSKLHTLDLSHCIILTALPDRIGDLPSLENLELQSCSKLARRPQRVDGRWVFASPPPH